MKTKFINSSHSYCDKNSIYINNFNQKNYTFLDFIKVGFGLSIRNRYADWFFRYNNISYCVIDKKTYEKCTNGNGNIMDCIKFMNSLEKCDYKI